MILVEKFEILLTFRFTANDTVKKYLVTFSLKNKPFKTIETWI